MLHYAAIGNSLWIGELLISKGADINAKTNENQSLFGDRRGKTPLHYATKNNSKEIGEILISKGTDINAKDINFQNLEIIFLIKKI